MTKLKCQTQLKSIYQHLLPSICLGALTRIMDLKILYSSCKFSIAGLIDIIKYLPS